MPCDTCIYAEIRLERIRPDPEAHRLPDQPHHPEDPDGLLPRLETYDWSETMALAQSGKEKMQRLKSALDAARIARESKLPGDGKVDASDEVDLNDKSGSKP